MALDLTGPLPGAAFGAQVATGGDAAAFVAAMEADPAALCQALDAHAGLLLLPGMARMAPEPDLLLRLSRLFGNEVEDYRETLVAANQVHPTVPEILVVSNVPPASRPPPTRPDPPLAADGTLPVQFPHRHGWHTDQSYRRPPPDISLFLCVLPCPKDQGQTLFADGTAAYAALAPQMQARLEGLEGLHAKNGTGRARGAVLAGETPRPLAPHERSQRQPVVRTHPVTGKQALYLCELGQMDWVDGPFVGMQPGPHGDGNDLLFELMGHLTHRRFVYAHEWTAGDLVIWDNRCLVHAATWFDAEHESRIMWRTTVSGNPGAFYAGEAASWLAA